MPSRIAASMDGASVPSSTISSTLFTPWGSADGAIARNVGLKASFVVASMLDRKSTRLNSSHGYISYAVFCLKKKKRIHCSAYVIDCVHSINQRYTAYV